MGAMEEDSENYYLIIFFLQKIDGIGDNMTFPPQKIANGDNGGNNDYN